MTDVPLDDSDSRLFTDAFPRASQYHPEWVIANAMGSKTLWLSEWLAGAMNLKPGMRVRILVAAGSFDAMVSVDSVSYCGTDQLSLNYLAQFVNPESRIGIAGAGRVSRPSPNRRSST